MKTSSTQKLSLKKISIANLDAFHMQTALGGGGGYTFDPRTCPAVTRTCETICSCQETIWL